MTYSNDQDINLDFVGNTSPALINTYSIGSITGDFVSNSVSAPTINNTGSIDCITGDFVRNTANGSTIGVIRNYYSSIGSIAGDFIGNSSNSGAIYNYSNSTIGNITGNFIANNGSAGAINNFDESTIGDIIGDFIGNSGTSSGAVYNASSTIDNITGDFIGNTTTGTYGGGAISNYYSSEIGNIAGDFIGNSATNSGGAIYNYRSTISDITGDFIGNTTTNNYGGAIYNYTNSKIGNITGDFIGNSAGYGGAIYNNGATIGDTTGDFIGNNSGSDGGAISNYYGTIGNITGDFIGNSSMHTGGAIYNAYSSTIGVLDGSGNLIGGIYGSFINNYTKTDFANDLALGGAVYTTTDMNFIADNNDVVFSGNYTEDPTRGKIANAIFVATTSNTSPTIKFIVQNNGTFTMNDQVEGGSAYYRQETMGFVLDYNYSYNLALDGDETGKIVINNDIINANITSDNTNVYVKEASNLAKSVSLDVRSGNFNINDFGSTELHFSNFANTGNINIANVDVDLINKSMGRIYADSYGDTTGSIDVQGLTLLNDATESKTAVLFADSAFADSVKYTGSSTVAYSPIHAYEVKYSKNPEDNLGYFYFTRGGSSSGSIEAFNPAVTPTAVTQQAGAFTTQMQTFNYAFQHSENFMNIPSVDRMVMRNQNRYAMSPTGDATDVGRYSPLFQKDHEHNGFWVKPYASFENVPLKNGPKVSNISYGTLIGYDTELKALKHGWDRVITGYVGYNGASQRYTGVDTYQNGGIAGFTNTLYKGNFFNATTLSVGSSVGSTTSMYGHEDYTMLLGGLGNKMGYNLEFKEGRYILQPSMLLSYTFVNTFDYTNAAGVRIDSDPMHAIQLAPGVKFIINTKNGWQPYLAVNIVWNILDKQKVMANDVRLPEMSIKPYVEYGMGIQRCFKQDRMTAFGQAMVHSGGRNGVSLTAGLRFKVGNDPNKVKAEKPKKEKQVKAEKVKKETKSQTTKTTKAPIIQLFGLKLSSEK